MLHFYAEVYQEEGIESPRGEICKEKITLYSMYKKQTFEREASDIDTFTPALVVLTGVNYIWNIVWIIEIGN